MNSVLSLAIVTGAEAIHPGFGFLSENSKFKNFDIYEEMRIKFIGPSAADLWIRWVTRLMRASND